MKGVFQSNQVHYHTGRQVWVLLPMNDATSQQFQASSADLEEFKSIINFNNRQLNFDTLPYLNIISNNNLKNYNYLC